MTTVGRDGNSDDPRSATDGRTVLRTSTVVLALFAVWWGGTITIDSALARRLPYERYEVVALLYPDVYYPALPGWFIGGFQPFPGAFWVVVVGWMLVLSVGIGYGVASFATARGRSPSWSAVVFVAALFLAVTTIEAVITTFP